MTRLCAVLLSALLGATLAGCGDSPADHGDQVPGRAREALDCAGKPWQQGAGDYDSGLEKVQGDARDSVESWLEEEGALVPDISIDEAGRQGQSVLFTWSEDGDRLGAFVVHDGMDDVEGNHGWGVASYAFCDPSFWPEAVATGAGYQIWTDGSGAPVLTGLVYSMAGSPDCGGEQMTFLYLGRDVFYGHPDEGFRQYATVPYAEHVAVPADARDTGYQREGREFRVTDQAAYLVGADGDAERWPAPNQQLGCD